MDIASSDASTEENAMNKPAELSLVAEYGAAVMGNPPLSRAALPTPTLSDRARLQLANTLQTTLMVDEVLRLFTSEARQFVNPFSLRYRNHADPVMYDEGRTYPNRISYDLDLHGASLGCITLSRSHAFSENEIGLFESMLCTLVYPLRNALMYERAIKSATVDPLTGIQNRTGLRQHLEHQVELCARHGMPLSVLMVDVDFFKAINDQHGHLVGDHVLVETVRNVIKATRNSDVVFRYGGDEFAVVLSNTGLEGAERLAQRICEGVSGAVVRNGEAPINVTVSIGVTEWEQGNPMVTLLERADHRLYEAKTTGRNRVVSC